MTFAANPHADPDPTTQMTWPSSRRNPSGSHTHKSGGGVESPQVERGPLRLDPAATGIKTFVNPAAKRLTTKDLIFLSISMAGAQIAWTVELGSVLHNVRLSSLFAVNPSLSRTCAYKLFVGRYGTPFLLSLGVSEQLTSLVWLAGPISGLIAQPLIGASISYDANLSFSVLDLRFSSLSPRSWSSGKIPHPIP